MSNVPWEWILFFVVAVVVFSLGAVVVSAVVDTVRKPPVPSENDLTEAVAAALMKTRPSITGAELFAESRALAKETRLALEGKSK